MSVVSMKTIVKTFGLSLLLFATIQTDCNAGGNSWEVRIEKMQIQSSSHATIVLNALEDDVFYQPCTKLLVEINWQPHLLRRRLSEDIAFKNHQEALASLQRDYYKGSSTRFGSMLDGLIQKQQQPKSWLESLLEFLLRLFGKVDPPLIDSSIPITCHFIAPVLEIIQEGATDRRVVYVLW
jgi:hypothetical protein